MGKFFVALLGWLPYPLQIVCVGVIAVFMLMTILHIICFILDLIPFL